jgi:hypothetical protein
MAKKKKAKSKPKPKKLTPQEQYDYMISRWGTSAKWGDAQVHLTSDEMEEYFGTVCEEFNPYCGNCKAWLEWNGTGKATVSFERDKFVKLLLEGKM